MDCFDFLWPTSLSSTDFGKSQACKLTILVTDSPQFPHSLALKCLGMDLSKSLIPQIKIPKEPLKKIPSDPSFHPHRSFPGRHHLTIPTHVLFRPREMTLATLFIDFSSARRGTQEVWLQLVFIYTGWRPPGFSLPKPRGCLPCLGWLYTAKSQVFQVEIFPS